MQGNDAHLRRRRVFALLQAGVAVGLLAWILSNPETRHSLATAFREGDPAWVAAGIAAAGASALLCAWRWWIFLRIAGVPATFRETAAAYFGGLFFNVFLPGVLGGDAARAILLARRCPGNKGAIIVSIGADHLSGLLALAISAFVFSGTRWEWFRQSEFTAGAFVFTGLYLAGGGLLIAVVFALTSQTGRKMMPRRMPGRRHLVKSAEAFQRYRIEWPRTLACVGISFFMLFLYYLSFWCSGEAFHAGVSLPDMLSIMPVADAISSVPVSIAGLGVREKFFEAILGILCGVESGRAVLVSLAGFAFSLVWGILGGALLCARAFLRHPIPSRNA